METLELEQVLDDLRTVMNRLAQLRHLNGATMHTPESMAAYHQALEAAYVAYGRIETIIDEIGEQLEAEHTRLDAALEQARTGSHQRRLEQNTLPPEEG
ncbi:MAG: hypothetical protein WCD86_08935 [Ktedonobacteraceae bacterium]|nr:hypothetical protein [Ktedonobacteraceae bacterium]